ncbi:MAG: sugar phosphate isomerase/epimerase [Acidobacteria bacterium]|nr:MAG: sugar phosphate isomerase/epimerase [Acidobacteriota bacterium]
MEKQATRRDFLKVSLAGALGTALGSRVSSLSAQGGVTNRLAVCSWSLQPKSAADLLEKMAATGLTRVQIALDPIRANEGGAWTSFATLASRGGVKCVSGMLGTVGEDYSTLESIRRTGGVVPDTTWPETWGNIKADAEIARALGLDLVTFHAGFLPHEETDPTFAKLQTRLRQIADLFAERKMSVALETGQEAAETLAAFLRKLDRGNVGVNFDPANMLLYDKGDPVAALRTLSPWLRQCHLKDAVRTKTPGTWGEEVRLGTGQVDWKAFFAALDAVGFKGDLCIEREAGKERVADIRAAREYVERLVRA